MKEFKGLSNFMVNNFFKRNRMQQLVLVSNQMIGRTIWDKLPECIFENFEIAHVKQKFLKSQGSFVAKIARTKPVLLVNHTKSTIDLY